MSGGKCALGVDVGTTAVKCAIVGREDRRVLAASNIAIDEVACDGVDGLQHGEQSVERVMRAVQRALAALPDQLRQRVESVGICGQMHGILWWHSDAVAAQIGKALDVQHEVEGEDKSSHQGLSERAWSHLATWQDQRCSPAFLEQCIAKIAAATGGAFSSTPLATGYGMATYTHTLVHAPEALDGFDACGTIQDFLAFVLCGHSSHSESTIDWTNAASWGCFDVKNSNWSIQAVTALEIPFEVLPTVKQPGEIIGSVAGENKFGLPSGIPVHVPIGDHPSSVITAITQQHQPAIGTATLDANQTLVNFGTSAQLAMILSEGEVRQIRSTNKSFEVRPFVFENQFLGVAASLSGGNIYAWFNQQCQQWAQELQMSSSTDDDARWYARLIDLGMQNITTDLEFLPTLNGERSDPTMKGSIQQLSMSNWSIGDISAALCKGLIDNLLTMVPKELHAAIRERKMIGTGSALVRNALLRHFLAAKLADPTAQLRIQDAADAAIGAALLPLLCQ
uniref:Carbohydrate kinase FGGY N-terminal domain-containing protein n=1 Tax=Globisporangium ultimum (strain ATCC 200006 / CBS 805.95 / DAOM BR144) TaxID=431595 RepID=K3XB25_GLOUD